MIFIRKVKFIRENDIRGALAEFHVIIDKEDYGNLAFHKCKIIELDCCSHVVEIQAFFSDGICKSMEYEILAGAKDYEYLVSLCREGFKTKIILNQLVSF